MTENWERCPNIEGSYVFDRQENLEPYFKATGDMNMWPHMKDYKMHIYLRGKQICFSDFYGEMGKFSNCMDLEVEMPFRAPGDREGRGFLKVDPFGLFLLQHMFYIAYTDTFSVKLSTDIWMFPHGDADHGRL